MGVYGLLCYLLGSNLQTFLRYNGLLGLLQSFSQHYQHDKSTFSQLIHPQFLKFYSTKAEY